MNRRTPRHRLRGVPLGLLGLAASAMSGAAQAVEPSLPTGLAHPPTKAVHAAGPGDVVLDVPYVAQTEALCGGAAVTMAFRYWGDETTHPERFAPLVTEDGAGIRTRDLRAAAADLGWSAFALTGDLVTVDRQLARGRPLIALLEVGPDRYHYVTVVGRIGGRIVFHDPAVSPYRTLSPEAFREAWAGGRYWAMLVLPGSDSVGRGSGATSARGASGRGVEAESPSPRPSPTAAETSIRRLGPGPASVDLGRTRCETGVDRGIRLARNHALGEAERALRSVTETCPGNARALRELAALRLRQDRPAEAAVLAGDAVERDPADRHAREILATSHFLAGDDVAALEQWNRLEPAVVHEVTLGAPTRTRNRSILGLAGLDRGRVLSGHDLAVGRKRLGLLPAAASTRLSYRPLPDGRVAATAAVAERPVVPSSARLLAEGALGLFTERGVRLRSASPLGYGELWSLDWRWREPRRRIEVSLALPVLGPVPGVVTVGGVAERETYRFDGETREERRRAEIGVRTWATPWLGLSLTAAADRWRDLGSFGSIGVETRLAGLGDRLGLLVGGEIWISPGDAPGFSRTRASLDWISSDARRGFVTSARLGARATSGPAPRSVWPGAGAGSGRDVRARGHHLLADGRITGSLFGRRLVHGGIETVRWSPAGPVDLGIAGFLDLAASGGRPPGIEGRAFQADFGLGLRIGLPGGDTLRLDVGRGLIDGDMAVSAGLVLDDASAR